MRENIFKNICFFEKHFIHLARLKCDMKRNDLSYNYVCFSELVYEFRCSDKVETEKKIKRRLKYYNLGDYDQEKIDYIRALRKELFEEISLRPKSNYFLGSKSKYSDLVDFDIDRMKIDYQKKYDKLNEEDLDKMLIFALYIFYLR